LENKPYRFYYGWVIVVVSFLTMFLVLGTRSSFGLFYAAVLNEYGWSRAETAGAFSLMMVIHAMMAPVTGILIDRLGPRKLFPLAALVLAVSLAASALITKMWHFYVCVGVFMAIGSNMLSYAPHISRIPRWFFKKKGLASGLVLSGMGLGTLGLALLSGFMIETRGWRQAFFLLGAIIFFVVIPINVFFQRRSPEEVGQGLESLHPRPNHPDDHGLKNQRSPANLKQYPKHWSFKAAFRTLPFWSLNMLCFFQGFFINVIIVHLAVFILDMGFSSMLAASSIGLVGLLSSVGGIIFGIFSDRVGRESAYFLVSGAAVLGIIFLLFIKESSSVIMIYLFVVSYGIGQGGIISVVAAATGDLFPGGSLGKIISMQAVTFGIGSALGAYSGGFFYDHNQSYTVTLLLALTAIIMSAVFLWIAAPRKVSVSQQKETF
jgi:MFS family permease